MISIVLSMSSSGNKSSQAGGKEQKLLDHLLSLPEDQLASIRGNPGKVLEAIDNYPASFMTIGKNKGKIIVDKMKEVKPMVMIELGCYVGYSAILFANELPKEQGTKYYSFEANPDFANIALQIIDLAGLSHKVQIIVGNAAHTLGGFRDTFKRQGLSYSSLDFIFIDHEKSLYVPDLRVLESLNLIAPGTVIAADNIIMPGAPEYVEYVQSSPEEKRDFNYRVENVNGKEFLGRWNIIYKTETIPAITSKGHKDAVEITECVEYLNG